MAARTTRAAVLLSGTGRTLENFFERIDAGTLDLEIVSVVADREGTRGIEIAKQRDIDTYEILPRNYDFVVEEFSKAITYEIEAHEPDLILMAGFLSMYKIPITFEGRVMNIHPSLIPAFAGKGFYTDRVHKAALSRGVRYSGCTVHFADNDYDSGPIILQEIVPVHLDDTPDTLAARIFEAECEAYPRAVQWFIEDRLTIEGSRVRVAGVDPDAPEPATESPDAAAPSDDASGEAS